MKKLISITLLLVCVLSCTFLMSCGKTELTLENYKQYLAINAQLEEDGFKDDTRYAKITVSIKKSSNVEFEGATINFSHGGGYYSLSQKQYIGIPEKKHEFSLELSSDGEASTTFYCYLSENTNFDLNELLKEVKNVVSVSGYVI